MLSPRCKVCGREMERKRGTHYRNVDGGVRLYKNVRQYVCPIGCSGSYFDFHRARPADKANKLFGIIPLPGNAVNVTDPLLTGGLVLAYILVVAGILATGGSAWIRLGAIGLLTLCGFWLLKFMQGQPENGNGDNGALSGGA